MVRMANKCVEAINLKGQTISCPNDAIGYYRDGDTYEMRRYPMCAAHAAGYGHSVDPSNVELDKHAWVRAVNEYIIRQMTKLADNLMSPDEVK